MRNTFIWDFNDFCAVLSKKPIKSFQFILEGSFVGGFKLFLGSMNFQNLVADKVDLIDNNSYRPTSKEAEKYSLDNSKIARILRQFKKVKSMVIKT